MSSTTDFPNVLSSAARNVSLSPIAKVGQAAARLAGEGRDIIALTAGEPDFDTPEAIKQAAIDAILRGQTKYTPTAGTGALRRAIADHYARRHGQGFSPEEVIVSNGVKQVIYNAFRATLDPGDEVILPIPYWPTFLGSVAINGGKAVVVETAREEDFQLTAARLEQAITPRTKWLVLNSPNNPAGTVYGERRLLDLAGVLRRHPQVLILLDEIYDHITFEPGPARGFLDVAPDLRARTVIANGVSKTYAMTGWRIGWAVAHPVLIEVIEAVQSQVSSGPSAISQAAALAALSGAAGDFLETSLRAYRERADFVVSAFNAIDGLVVYPPRGSFFAWIDCSGVLGRIRPDGQELRSDQDVAGWLLEHGVAVVPGQAYGQSPFLRLSFAASLDELKRAHGRIAGALSALRTA